MELLIRGRFKFTSCGPNATPVPICGGARFAGFPEPLLLALICVLEDVDGAAVLCMLSNPAPVVEVTVLVCDFEDLLQIEIRATAVIYGRYWIKVVLFVSDFSFGSGSLKRNIIWIYKSIHSLG